MNVSLRARLSLLAPLFSVLFCLLLALPASAQSRFNLRAEPDVIAANGISTTSIFVQVPQNNGAISAVQTVRFATTAGVIESQAQLSGGVARALLRSASTPGTAIVTAFIGNSREAITVEFSEENGLARRYLEVAAPYVAYGADTSLITASGKAGLDFGDTHIESDVRLDVDLTAERVWAQGTKGSVVIRHGRGNKMRELRGDRLFFDLRRNKGVMRRAEIAGEGLTARQEFVGSNFDAPPDPGSEKTSEPESPIKPVEAGKNPAEEAVKPPLAPSPSLELEDDDNRGSTFVAPPTEPPTASPEAKNSAAAAAPIVEPTEDKTVDKVEASKAEETKNITVYGDLNDRMDTLSTVAKGSLADTAQPPSGSESFTTSLALPPKKEGDIDPKAINPPPYTPLPSSENITPRVVELPPPGFKVDKGYWITSRRLRVFPRDKVQFERASVYFNGGKAFSMPLYVLPLDGSFNPATDMFSVNSQAGIRAKFPIPYQASKTGTGVLYLNHEPGNGFSTKRAGFGIGLEQQYWLSPNSHGRFGLDQIGRGAWDLNYQHEMRFSPDTTGSFYLNMPRHRDMFARASLAKEMRKFQIGFEAFYDNPQTTEANLRGQFFARSRPKAIAKTGWSYTMSANLLAVKRGYNETITIGGGGIGLPGSGASRTFTRSRPILGQTFTASLQSPLYSPWRGGNFTANLLTTAYNYSNDRRGLAPGVILGYSQKLGRADLRLDYTYDRSNLGLYGLNNDSFTNYVSGTLSAQVTKKVGLSTFISQSLNDSSVYGSADLDYNFAPKWRTGIFADYTNVTDVTSLFTYGFTLGRSIGARELSINYDTNRGRVYFELGTARY